jgi:hypothetical protein
MAPIEVYASGSWVGFHRWKDAPEAVAFLRDKHRHVFHWKLWWPVSDEHRQVEFCSAKEKVSAWIRQQVQGDVELWSCERWALYLLEQFQACRAEVSEDGENGAVVTR